MSANQAEVPVQEMGKMKIKKEKNSAGAAVESGRPLKEPSPWIRCSPYQNVWWIEGHMTPMSPLNHVSRFVSLSRMVVKWTQLPGKLRPANCQNDQQFAGWSPCNCQGEWRIIRYDASLGSWLHPWTVGFRPGGGSCSLWHSSAHVLGEACEKHYGCHLCLGPPLTTVVSTTKWEWPSLVNLWVKLTTRPWTPSPRTLSRRSSPLNV